MISISGGTRVRAVRMTPKPGRTAEARRAARSQMFMRPSRPNATSAMYMNTRSAGIIHDASPRNAAIRESSSSGADSLGITEPASLIRSTWNEIG